MFKKILVVCVGNICRSPIGERLLKRELGASVEVSSAGLGALAGKPADPNSILVSSERDLDLSGHVARQISNNDLQWADLILVMEQEHIAHITKMAPQVRGKTKLLGNWLDGQEIPDPYRKSKEAFEYCYNLIEKSVLAWKKYL